MNINKLRRNKLTIEFECEQCKDVGLVVKENEGEGRGEGNLDMFN